MLLHERTTASGEPLKVGKRLLLMRMRGKTRLSREPISLKSILSAFSVAAAVAALGPIRLEVIMLQRTFRRHSMRWIVNKHGRQQVDAIRVEGFDGVSEVDGRPLWERRLVVG